MWPLGLIWVMLWIGSAAIVTWTGAHFIVAVLRGITGFDEYWQPPVGLAILGLFVWALLTYRDPSPWRAIAIAAFVTTSLAFATATWFDDPAVSVFKLTVIAAMLTGTIATVVSFGRGDGQHRFGRTGGRRLT